MVYSKAAACIAALLCIASWWVQTNAKDLTSILTLVLSLALGYLLLRANRELSLSDTRCTLPATLFYMGCALLPALLAQRGVGLHFAFFGIACYLLLRTYRDREAMGRYFLAFSIIGIECLLAPRLLFTLPLLVLMGAFVESLHVRSFFAALLGLMLPYWVAFCTLFLTDRVGEMAQFFDFANAGIPPMGMFTMSGISLPLSALPMLWVLLLALPGCVKLLLDRTLKQRANAGYRFLIGVVAILILTIAVSGSLYLLLLPSTLLLSSFLGSSLFMGARSRAKNIYLILLLVLWLLFIYMGIWSNFAML